MVVTFNDFRVFLYQKEKVQETIRYGHYRQQLQHVMKWNQTTVDVTLYYCNKIVY